MSNSSLLMAATASTTTSPLSSSLPLYSNLPLEHHRCSLTFALHFPFKSKPFKHSKLTTHFSSLHALTRSATFCASADSVEAEQEEEEADEIEEEEEEDDDDVESQSDESGRLYVGNLPFSLTSSQLTEIFSEAGRVSKVEMVYDRVTGRSRGFAFVTMGSVKEANEAIRMFNGSQVGGRTARVNFPEVPRGGEREVITSRLRSYSEKIDSPHRLYAVNLSWSLTSQGLREAFADQPGFLSAKVAYDRESGRSRGFGFVSFASAEEMQSALDAMNGVDVEGRPLRLYIAKEKGTSLPPSGVETNPERELEMSSEIPSSVSS